MSRAAITWKFKLRWFPNERPYKAGKLKLDMDLVPLMPDDDKIFRGPLIWIRGFDDVNCTSSIRNHPYFSFGCLLRRVFRYLRYLKHLRNCFSLEKQLEAGPGLNMGINFWSVLNRVEEKAHPDLRPTSQALQ